MRRFTCENAIESTWMIAENIR